MERAEALAGLAIGQQERLLAEDAGVVRHSVARCVGLDFTLVPREAEGPAVVLRDEHGE